MKTASNLLSTNYQKRQHLLKFLRQWTPAWIGCLLLGALVSANQWRIVHYKNHGFSEVDSQHQEIQDEMRKGDALQLRIRQLEADRNHYRSIANTNVPLSLVGMLAKSAKSTNGRLRLNAINVRETVMPSQKNRKESRQLMIDIEGAGTSDQAVGQFVRVLHQSGVFETVELKSSRGTASAEKTARQFRIQCILPSQSEATENDKRQSEKV